MGAKKKSIERHLSWTERPVQKGQPTQDKCHAASGCRRGRGEGALGQQHSRGEPGHLWKKLSQYGRKKGSS